MFRWRFVLCGSVTALGIWGTWGWIDRQALAAGATPANEARALVHALAAEASVRELVAPATTRAQELLSRAEASSAAPARAALLEAAALEWAQVARDLKRARDAEQASDRLEQELSALQTEIVRSRVAVEQAVARVGRARQELLELEAATAKPGSAPGSPRAR